MSKQFNSLQPNLYYIYSIRDALDTPWPVVILGTSDLDQVSPGEHLLETTEYNEVYINSLRPSDANMRQ